MTFTYGGDPASSDRDAVRLLVGDTDSDDPQLVDGEVDYFLSSTGAVRPAALAAARAILAKYARKVDQSVGDLRYAYSQRRAAYEALVGRLERDAAVKGAVPYAGGISQSDKETDQDDSDRVQPAFYRGQFDDPATETGPDTEDADDY